MVIQQQLQNKEIRKKRFTARTVNTERNLSYVAQEDIEKVHGCLQCRQYDYLLWLATYTANIDTRVLLELTAGCLFLKESSEDDANVNKRLSFILVFVIVVIAIVNAFNFFIVIILFLLYFIAIMVYLKKNSFYILFQNIRILFFSLFVNEMWHTFRRVKYHKILHMYRCGICRTIFFRS